MQKSVKNLLLTTAFSISLSFSAQAGPSEDFEKILDDHWAMSLKEYPSFASRLGHREYDGKLGTNTARDRARRLAYNGATLKRLEKIDPDQLSKNNQLNYAIFKRARVMEEVEAQHPGHLFPFTNRGGWHMYFAQGPANTPFLEKADYEGYLGQLADYPRYNEENMALLREGLAKGYMQYCKSMEGFDKSISTHIVDDVKQSAFFAPFKRFPGKISKEDQARLTARGTKLIKEDIIPAYKKLHEYYTTQYGPGCRKEVGISSIEGGADFYQYLIENFTTTSMSADEIHTLGLSEVKRLRAEMAKIIKKVEFKGDFKAFVHFLRTDPQFYTDDPVDLLEKTALISKRMDGELPKLFGFLPRNPYGMKEIPHDIAEKTTTAYYMPSNGDGKTAGYYYVNTSLLKSRPLYTQEALSFHEAVPGHHLQLAIQKELDIPIFRKFQSFTAFVEGWALYSERLGLEVGFYKDPYSDFGRLTYEMWRALRLVVDTGMHMKGWSREKAIQFMADNSALTLHNITTEVDRYITWPGQALAYKIGELRITALRKKAEKTLGEKFDLRAFHDVVLGNGAVPIVILENVVNQWIDAQK